jgi:hypothetical protein
MNIKSDLPRVEVGPAAKVIAYYDRPTHAWWAYLADAQDHQIGDAVDNIDRAAAIRALGRQAMVFDLARTPTLLDAYNKLDSEPKSAYELWVSIAALRNLVDRKLALDVTDRNAAGGMFSPTTHYKFIKA